MSQWINEVQNARLAAEYDLAQSRPKSLMTPNQIRKLIEGLGDMFAVLRDAEIQMKIALYMNVGLRLTFQPKESTVSAELLLGPETRIQTNSGVIFESGNLHLKRTEK